jgi:protein-tyrosine phosphatase
MFESVLVVCTGNICRSPMAEALLAERGRERNLRVASAGTAALIGYPPPAPAIELMAERGLDISTHRARQLTDALALKYDLLLVMEQAQQRWIESQWPLLKGRVYRLGGGGSEEVPDPYGQAREVFAGCLRQINSGVEAWAKRLMQG